MPSGTRASVNEKPSRSEPNTASASNPAAAPGLRSDAQLRHRSTAAQHLDLDLDRAVRDPAREHAVQAAERLRGLAERRFHRPRRRRDDPTLGTIGQFQCSPRSAT